MLQASYVSQDKKWNWCQSKMYFILIAWLDSAILKLDWVLQNLYLHAMAQSQQQKEIKSAGTLIAAIITLNNEGIELDDILACSSDQEIEKLFDDT